MDTESDVCAPGPRPRRSLVDTLYVAFHGSTPLHPPSRHVLVDIDVVQFGRGSASARRAGCDGLRHLVLRIPDSQMSARHGRLVHAHGAWMIDDPSSKNGAFVDGVPSRSGRLEPGQLLALGNTILFLAREECDGPLDLDVAALPAPRPELATFDRQLGDTLARVAKLATDPIPMLVLGESGTGKEVIARAIHELSGRRGPFVAVNCAAIAPTLLEAELFGHRRGAFSGAFADRLGHIRTSDHGTLFLDEIAELSPHAQVALLRVLQEREVTPLGDTLPIAVDLRVVAATNRDLAARMTDGRFREDLHARIAGFTLTLPPLRSRRADLGLLIRALLQRRPRADRVKLTWQAGTELFRHAWPGNVRELDHTLETAVALAGRDPVMLDHLPDTVRAPRPQPLPAPDENELRLRIEHMLEVHDHNVAEVARAFGKDRTQIYRWMRRFGMRRGGAESRERS